MRTQRRSVGLAEARATIAVQRPVGDIAGRYPASRVDQYAYHSHWRRHGRRDRVVRRCPGPPASSSDAATGRYSDLERHSSGFAGTADDVGDTLWT